MLHRGRSQGDRSLRFDNIVAAVGRQLRAGEAVDIDSIQQSHPDLKPELRQRLEMLVQIEHAARVAEARRSEECGPTLAEVDADILADEKSYLTEALPEYELMERLREGGQGVVYKARERVTGRIVAVKILLDGPMACSRRRERFAREVELVSRLRHPNIVTLYHNGLIRGRPFFAMEHIEGLPIDDYALLRDQTAGDLVGLCITICHALTYAHQRGIIHRDLKPSNLLIDADGQPHVLDFGLAKDIGGSGGTPDEKWISLPGHPIGTVPYLSPEQVDANQDVDIRSDIYSLAIVLFEILTASYPYSVDGDFRSVARNILEVEPARLCEVAGAQVRVDNPATRGINSDLEAVLLKALEKN